MSVKMYTSNSLYILILIYLSHSLNVVKFTLALNSSIDGYYLIDKVHSLYDKYCNDGSSTTDNLYCVIVENINGYIHRFDDDRSNLISLNDSKRDSCYYIKGMNIFANDGKTLLTKYVSANVTMRMKFRNPAEFLSLLETNRAKSVFKNPGTRDMELIWTKCINFASEICRVGQDFSSGMAALYKKNNTNIRALYQQHKVVNTELNYPISGMSLDFNLPTSKFINNWLYKAILDRIYLYHKSMLIKAEDDLYRRDCILFNELDLLFGGVHSYPESIYNLILKMRIHIMSAYYNMASVLYRKCDEKWLSVQQVGMDKMKDILVVWSDLFKWFEYDLSTTLNLMLTSNAFLEFVGLTERYMTECKNLSMAYGPTETGRYNNALKNWKAAQDAMINALTSQFNLPLKHGIMGTKAYFSSALLKYETT